MKYLLALIVLVALASNVGAALIPYYRMDSLAYLSSDIVLCDEVGYVEKRSPRGYAYYEATFTVVETLKGTCRPKDQLTVDVDRVFTREVTGLKRKRKEKRPAFPLARALPFLRKEDGAWQLNDMKLIVHGEAYCYGQFESNPGPLWLARMAPENIEVPETTAYGEELLLKDLRIALEKAKELTKATSTIATDDLIREPLKTE